MTQENEIPSKNDPKECFREINSGFACQIFISSSCKFAQTSLVLLKNFPSPMIEVMVTKNSQKSRHHSE